MIVPGEAAGAAFPAAGAAATTAVFKVGSYNSMVCARRAKFEGGGPGPRWGGSRYRPCKVGRRAGSSVVGQESGSSPAEREVRAQARAAQRSLISLAEVLTEGEMPESARYCCCCALAGMTIFGCAEVQSLANEGAGGMVACSCSKVIKVPVVGENFREEVRTGEVFAEEVLNSRRKGLKSR